MLASPHFVFRFERVPPNVAPGHNYNISDVELASRLSFFLWGTIPDGQLLAAATARKLSDPATLNAQVRRMLADPRAEALATRFAAQWLRLQDLDLVHPDPFWFPDFDQQLADAMRRETELFFADLVRRNASLFDLWTADYTFVNERLARHYGIPNVAGSRVPARDLRRYDAARVAGPRQHPRADIARESHVTGVARQVGDGGAHGHGAAATAA